MADITEKERRIMSITEKSVCKYFDISIEKIVSKDLTNDTVMARNCIYYILHEDNGVSISKIASEYFRGERSVKSQLAKMRVCMKSNKAYRSVHDQLLELMKKGGK